MAVELIPDEWSVTIDERCISLQRMVTLVKKAGPLKGETVRELQPHGRYYSTPVDAANGILRIIAAEQADTSNAATFAAALEAAVARITAVLLDAGTHKPSMIAEMDEKREAAAAARQQTA